MLVGRGKVPFSQYFVEWEVKPDFEKEAISLWPGWLGQADHYKLEEVTEGEWALPKRGGKNRCFDTTIQNGMKCRAATKSPTTPRLR